MSQEKKHYESPKPKKQEEVEVKEFYTFEDNKIPEKIHYQKVDTTKMISSISPPVLSQSSIEKPDPRVNEFEQKLRKAINDENIQEMAELIFEIKDLKLQSKVKLYTDAENKVYG